MRKLLQIILLATVISVLVSCTTQDDENCDEVFFIENKNAKMPVNVRGNRESDTYILMIHGGPGMGAFSLLEGCKQLENSYRCIYWDQRGAGSSLGNPSKETFTLEQHVEDMELLVQTIRAKYSVGSLFIMAHSWGGALATSFLLNKNNQNSISGWIDVGGGHNIKRGHQLSRKMIIDHAHAQVQADKDSKQWKKAIEWYNENPTMTSIVDCRF
ncbi:MAG: alpha/beta fold hydrolase, partial [Proteobacteria bacterium]|nr:alpha/beta fold hydrolase [Pseudomonadota bacterium]